MCGCCSFEEETGKAIQAGGERRHSGVIDGNSNTVLNLHIAVICLLFYKGLEYEGLMSIYVARSENC